MKSFMKVIAALVVFFVVVVAGLSIFVRYYLTDERLQELIVPQAEKALGRQVSIGDIGVSLFKGVTVNDLVVKEAGGEENFVSTGSFVLRYDLLPLLQQKIVVSEVLLKDPAIRVFRNEEGKFNFESLALLGKKEREKETPAPSKSPGEAALPLALTVDKIKIENARFNLTDAKGELPTLDARADLDISVDLGQDISTLQFQGSGSYEVQAAYQGVKSEVEGTLAVNKEQFSTDFEVLVDGERVRVTTLVKNYGAAPDIECHLQSKKLQVDKLLALAGGLGKDKGEAVSTTPAAGMSGGPAKKEAIGGAIPAGLTAHGTVKVEEALYRDLTINDFGLAYRLEKNVLTVSDLAARLAEGTLTTQAKLDLNDPAPVYDGSLAMSSIALTPLQEALFPKITEKLSGMLSTEMTYAGKGFKWPGLREKLSADGTFSLKEGQIKNSDLATSIARLTGITELENLAFNDFSGNFKVRDGDVLVKSSIDGKGLEVETAGRIGLDTTLELPMTLKLSPELSARLEKKSSIARYLADEQGQTTLRLKLAGTLKKPKPTLDSGMVKEQLENTLRQKAMSEIDRAMGGDKKGKEGEKDPAKSALEEAGKGLLKGIFGQ